MKKKKVIEGILFTLLIIMITFSGCDWFGKGLFNILDPEAEVKMYYLMNESTDVGEEEEFSLLSSMTFDLVVYPLNEIGFTINSLEYRYYSDGVLIPELSKDFATSYYIPPNNPYNPYPSPGTSSINIPSPVESSHYVFQDIPLMFQDGIDYLWKHYELKNITLTLTAIIEDDARHAIVKPVIQNFPVLQMGEDFEPPEVEILPKENIEVPAGSTVVLIAQAKDNYMIKSYKWMVSGGGGCSMCGGGSSFSSEGQVFSRTFSDPGNYSVVVEVCDFAGNCSYAAKTITITGEI
ncbi:MAG: hypothetical protein GX432_05830 [Candidatus Atribacteria bacterium]|nr:hypothetical protein [Candidatus Atribacteria bacterium]